MYLQQRVALVDHVVVDAVQEVVRTAVACCMYVSDQAGQRRPASVCCIKAHPIHTQNACVPTPAPLGQHPLQGLVEALRHILRQQHIQAAAQAGLVVGVRDHADPHQEGDQHCVDGQYHRDAPAAESHWTQVCFVLFWGGRGDGIESTIAL